MCIVGVGEAERVVMLERSNVGAEWRLLECIISQNTQPRCSINVPPMLNTSVDSAVPQTHNVALSVMCIPMSNLRSKNSTTLIHEANTHTSRSKNHPKRHACNAKTPNPFQVQYNPMPKSPAYTLNAHNPSSFSTPLPSTTPSPYNPLLYTFPPSPPFFELKTHPPTHQTHTTTPTIIPANLKIAVLFPCFAILPSLKLLCLILVPIFEKTSWLRSRRLVSEALS